jgi:hypothetical protein
MQENAMYLVVKYFFRTLYVNGEQKERAGL